jgi:hypothetical protein
VNDLTKNILVFVVIIVVLLSVVQGLSGVNGAAPEKKDYSEFLQQVRSGHVDRAEFDGEKISFGSRTPLQYYTISPETDNNTLIGILEAALALIDHLSVRFIARLRPTIVVAHAAQSDRTQLSFGPTEPTILHQ